jgi:hypothetical protein
MILSTIIDVEDHTMKLITLSIILLFLVISQTFSAGWEITVTMGAYPDETFPAGWIFQGICYENMEWWVGYSGGDSITTDRKGFTDTPSVNIYCNPVDLPLDVKIISVDITLTTPTTIIVGPTQTKTFTIPYEVTNNAYISQYFTSAFPAL